MNTKQAHRAYLKSRRPPKISYEEQRRIEREEQQRIREELAKRQVQARAAAARDRRRKREKEERLERKRMGLPATEARASQEIITRFFTKGPSPGSTVSNAKLGREGIEEDCPNTDNRCEAHQALPSEATLDSSKQDPIDELNGFILSSLQLSHEVATAEQASETAQNKSIQPSNDPANQLPTNAHGYSPCGPQNPGRPSAPPANLKATDPNESDSKADRAVAGEEYDEQWWDSLDEKDWASLVDISARG